MNSLDEGLLVVWWVRVCRCVDSLFRLKGPMRQLLVFVLSFSTWLSTRLCVAVMTIGAWLLVVWWVCSRLSFDLLGSFRLSSIMLQAVMR